MGVLSCAQQWQWPKGMQWVSSGSEDYAHPVRVENTVLGSVHTDEPSSSLLAAD